MRFTPWGINFFNFFNLPSVWWTGVRVKHIDANNCEVKVTYRWVNQNPFKSLFWAVQGMAAELTTGVLLMQAIAESKRNISLLVLNNNATFSKKGRGKITFKCNQGELIREVIKKTIETKKPQTIWLNAKGVDQANDEISSFSFEWTLLLKK